MPETSVSWYAHALGPFRTSTVSVSLISWYLQRPAGHYYTNGRTFHFTNFRYLLISPTFPLSRNLFIFRLSWGSPILKFPNFQLAGNYNVAPSRRTFYRRPLEVYKLHRSQLVNPSTAIISLSVLTTTPSLSLTVGSFCPHLFLDPKLFTFR